MTGSVARLATAMGCMLSLVGCGRAKEIAERDVKTAEQTVATVQDEGSKLVPDRLKAVTAVIERAKDQLIAGDYRAAKKAAEESMAEARALPAVIASKKAELRTSFKAVADSVAPMLVLVQARLDSILTSKRLPPGVDPGKVAVLKAELPGWQDEWRTANASFEAGDLSAALVKAREIKARAEDAKATLAIP